MKIKIYSGLSLKKSEVSALASNFDFSGPVGRGQLLNDIKAGYHIIGIIDGVFHSQLAVSPSEIMDCLRNGISVFGSSSMGALRAAEIDVYGMIGVGSIYEFVKYDKNFEDDFLAQTFFDEKLSGASVPLIDIYLELRYLVAKGKLTKSISNLIYRHYRDTHFSLRQSLDLADFIKKSPLTNKLSSKIIKKITKPTNFKHRDGLMLLKEIQKHVKKISDFQSNKD